VFDLGLVIVQLVAITFLGLDSIANGLMRILKYRWNTQSISYRLSHVSFKAIEAQTGNGSPGCSDFSLLPH